jgi:hypothetical protein
MSLFEVIVQVVVLVSFQVVRSALLQVTLIELPKSVHHSHEIVPVMTMLQVAHHARLLIKKVFGLVVVKFAGYVSVIVKSPVSGPLFPYVIVYCISSQL